jgi:hypothetical protein
MAPRRMEWSAMVGDRVDMVRRGFNMHRVWYTGIVERVRTTEDLRRWSATGHGAQ